MRTLDDQLRVVHETYWSDQQQAARGKSVILVEGDDDRDVLESILRQRARSFETRVRVVVAGGRTNVLKRMESTFPQALGLVDRDVWTEAYVDEQRKQEPRLFVTEGWCLENLFLSPDWLRTYDGRVATKVAAERERWVRAGALWWALQRTRDAQQRWQEALGWSYGSPRDDLGLTSVEALVDSLRHRIPEEVRSAARLDLDAVAESFVQRLNHVLNLSEATQWQVGVHGKRAFNELLIPALQDAHGQRGWRVELARAIGRPPPLDDLVAMLLP